MNNSDTLSLHPNEKLEKWEIIHALAVLVYYQNKKHDIKFTCNKDTFNGWRDTMNPSY